MSALLLLVSSCTALALLSPLDPAHAPCVTVDITPLHSVRLRVPEDDAVMEAVMSRAQAEAAAAGPDLYDEVMEERCRSMLSDSPQYWAQVWPSAVAASRLLLLDQSLVSGKTVLEIGAGLGLCSICAALAGAAAVVATDGDASAVSFATANAAQNDVQHLMRAAQLDWSQPDEFAASEEFFDVVLAADVIYDESAARMISKLLHARVLPGGLVLLTDNADRPYEDRRRETLMRLLCERGDFEEVVAGGRRTTVELETRQGAAFTIAELVLRRKP